MFSLSHSRLLGNGFGLTYQDSGVDITAGCSLVHAIQPLTSRTMRKGVIGSIGGFGGLFDLDAAGFKDPILVSGADGVGTKLKVRVVDEGATLTISLTKIH